MRNLRLQGERQGQRQGGLASVSEPFVDRVRLVELDDGEGRVFLTTKGRLLRVSNDTCATVWETSLDQVLTQGSEAGTWFSVTLVDTDLVCLSRSGAIVTVDPLSGDASLVGEFDHGIFNAVWSPDREILVLATLAEPASDEAVSTGGPTSVLLCMTADFQVLSELFLEPHVVEEALYLTWRPDGSLLAVSSVDQSDATRKIRIYERNPSLQLAALGRTEDGSGKLIPHLQSTPLAWASAGGSQLLASIVPKGRKDLQVALIEPNGLRHGQFLLRLSDAATTHVVGIAWNSLSDIFMVHTHEAAFDAVQLWTRSNYHWYPKWSRRFPERCTKIAFDDEDPYLMDILLQNGEWRECKLRWEVSNVDPFGTAVVVDGDQLLLTPLEKALVPPPMAAAAISLPCALADFVIGSNADGSEPLLVVILADESIAVYCGTDPAAASGIIPNYRPPAFTAKTKLPARARSWRSWCIIGDYSDGRVELLAVQAGSSYAADILVQMTLTWAAIADGPSEASLEVKREVLLENRLLVMVPWSDSSDGVLLELVDGELLDFSHCDGTLSPIDDTGRFLEPCPWIAGLRHPNAVGSQEVHRQRLVVGMSERSRLFCHDLLLADSISSFFLDRKHGFLCFATAASRCELRFVPLAELSGFDPLLGLDEMLPLLRGYEPRLVERGTRVVAVLREPSVVLQMPRGNLEGIYPRALVLQHSMRQIQLHDFGSAFKLMRRQKVDVNLLVDMDPHYFVDGMGAVELIEQILNVEHLNLFISTLQNWNSTEARYPVPHWLPQSLGQTSLRPYDFDFTQKVNLVCERLRVILTQAEDDGRTTGGRTIPPGHYLLPILSTFAKQDPPQLELALSLIKSQAELTHGKSSRRPPLFSDSAQNSIQYLAFLADYDLLFNTALGIYDYDLARAVARNSQMDPKCYLPLLKRYRELPKFFGRYEVDLRLKRFAIALRNLHTSSIQAEDVSSLQRGDGEPLEGNGFEECFQLIEEQKLHDLGLELFQEMGQQRRILLDLGDMLLDSKQAVSALNIFLITTPVDREKIMKAARACWEWRVFFAHAFPERIETQFDGDKTRLEIESSKRRMIARDVAEELEASAQVGTDKRRAILEASRLLLDYGDDVGEATETLLRGQWWEEAKRIATMHGKPDLRRKTVDAAIAYSQSCIDDCQERSKVFVETSKRYAEVLQIRKKAYATGELDALGLIESGQDVDETGSVFSAASQSSNLSNMSRGSTGSAGSISTVISARSATSFSLSGAEETYRHKSKYNEIGKKAKKKKKKKNKGRSKVMPGSEQELQGLVETLRASFLDTDEVDLLAETVVFLSRERQLELARELYLTFTDSSTQIRKCQEDQKITEHRRENEYMQQNPGKNYGKHPSETLVETFQCSELPAEVHHLQQYIPALVLASNQ
jgi:elongator complex protein 1